MQTTTAMVAGSVEVIQILLASIVAAVGYAWTGNYTGPAKAEVVNMRKGRYFDFNVFRGLYTVFQICAAVASVGGISVFALRTHPFKNETRGFWVLLLWLLIRLAHPIRNFLVELSTEYWLTSEGMGRKGLKGSRKDYPIPLTRGRGVLFYLIDSIAWILVAGASIAISVMMSIEFHNIGKRALVGWYVAEPAFLGISAVVAVYDLYQAATASPKINNRDLHEPLREEGEGRGYGRGY